MLGSSSRHSSLIYYVSCALIIPNASVLKDENVMDDNDTLKESLLQVMPMVTINEPQRPNGVLLLSIQVPRRFAHLYPRF